MATSLCRTAGNRIGEQPRQRQEGYPLNTWRIFDPHSRAPGAVEHPGRKRKRARIWRRWKHAMHDRSGRLALLEANHDLGLEERVPPILDATHLRVGSVVWRCSPSCCRSSRRRVPIWCTIMEPLRRMPRSAPRLCHRPLLVEMRAVSSRCRLVVGRQRRHALRRENRRPRATPAMQRRSHSSHAPTKFHGPSWPQKPSMLMF